MRILRDETQHAYSQVSVCRFDPTLLPVQLGRHDHLFMLLQVQPLGSRLGITTVLFFAWDKVGVVVKSFASSLTFFHLFASAAVTVGDGLARNFIP